MSDRYLKKIGERGKRRVGTNEDGSPIVEFYSPVYGYTPELAARADMVECSVNGSRLIDGGGGEVIDATATRVYDATPDEIAAALALYRSQQAGVIPLGVAITEAQPKPETEAIPELVNAYVEHMSSPKRHKKDS